MEVWNVAKLYVCNKPRSGRANLQAGTKLAVHHLRGGLLSSPVHIRLPEPGWIPWEAPHFSLCAPSFNSSFEWADFGSSLPTVGAQIVFTIIRVSKGKDRV